MNYNPLKIIPSLIFILLFNNCGNAVKENEKPSFIKGVYGNPATLLKEGYSFDSLGMNAVFVRSSSLNREFYETSRKQGCKVFVEFPTLLGKTYLQDHPEAWPVNEKGEPSPAADWFMGICPTNPGFKEYRTNQLKEILLEFEVDGIFLDYVHWHAQFETPDPILPETCFCDHCTSLFSEFLGSDIPGMQIKDKASWILGNTDYKWREWRNSILNGWIEDMGGIVHELRPEAKLGVYYCAWYPSDHDSALYRILGIDVAGISEIAQVLSPMLFHRMKNRPTEWVGEYLDWLDDLTKAGKTGTPLVWPIVQAHNKPGVITPEEFRQVMTEGSGPPSSGIMMFSDQSLLQDPKKIEVMKELYLKVLN